MIQPPRDTGMKPPRDMDLTKAALQLKATISMARSLRRMGKPDEAAEKTRTIADDLKKLSKMQSDFMKTSPGSPRLGSNAKLIKEAQDDYESYSKGK